MLIAHGPVGYIANELIQKKQIEKLKFGEQVVIAFLSIFFAILPDFDFFFLILKGLPSFLHHNLLTHTLIFYILFWIILRVFIKPIYALFGKKLQSLISIFFLQVVVNTFLIATVSHIIMDVLTTNIMLFYPISTTKYFLLKDILEYTLSGGYTWGPMMALELVSIPLFLLMFSNKFLKKNSIIRGFLYASILFSLFYFVFTVFLSMNIYCNSYMYDSKGNMNYDTDYDKKIDTDDMYIGNNGLDNIENARAGELSDAALNIVNSKKWTVYTYKTGIIAKMQKKFGAMNSYRVVSQSYFNIHYPIEPVLADFYKRTNTRSYDTQEMKLDTVLLEYLQKKNMLIDLNMELGISLPYGKLFFLMDKNNDIINMGITLEGNFLATVLEDDRYLEMHSYADVKEYYRERIQKIYIQK